MTLYNVHIYREVRLMFENIEADTPEAAAQAVVDIAKAVEALGTGTLH